MENICDNIHNDFAEPNSVDGCIRALAICNRLAVLVAQCSATTELTQRVTVLAQLHHHWTLKHHAKVICLTCDNEETFNVKTIAETTPVTEVLSSDGQYLVESNEPDFKCQTELPSGTAKDTCEEMVQNRSGSTANVGSTIKNRSRRSANDDHQNRKLNNKNNAAVRETRTRRPKRSASQASQQRRCTKSIDDVANELEPSASASVPSDANNSNETFSPPDVQEDAAATCKVKHAVDSSATAGRANFMCAECGRQFRLRQLLAAHVVTHTGDRPYACRHPGCSKRFGQTSTRNFHERTHSDARPFVCSRCGLGFKQPSYLKIHTSIVHDAGDDRDSSPRPKHRCDRCDKVFKASHALGQHVRNAHSDERAQACDSCPKRFKNRQQLARHKAALHAGERPWRCLLCARSFTQSGNLRIHMRTHTGEKPYACNMCAAVFRHSGTLKGHVATRHRLDAV